MPSLEGTTAGHAVRRDDETRRRGGVENAGGIRTGNNFWRAGEQSLEERNAIGVQRLGDGDRHARTHFAERL